MELYVYLGLGVSLFLIVFCVLFFPLRKKRLFNKVMSTSLLIHKILELNGRFPLIDVDYKHNIQDSVELLGMDDIGNFDPDEEFRKHVSQLEDIYDQQLKNQSLYKEYKSLYNETIKNVTTPTDVIQSTKIKEKKYRRIEGQILDSLFQAVWDDEPVYYSVYADFGSTLSPITRYYAKDHFTDLDNDSRMESGYLPYIDEPKNETSDEVKKTGQIPTAIKEEEDEKPIEEFVVDDILYHVEKDDKVTIKGLKNEELTSVELSGRVFYKDKEYHLDTIPENVFTNNKSITFLILLEGIKVIEQNAFRNCSSLEKVEFPLSLRKIGRKAFNGDAKLEYITLPGGLEELGDESFALCSDIVCFSLSGKTKYVGRSILWLVESVEIHIRDTYPSLWHEKFNVENSKIIYDFEE